VYVSQEKRWLPFFPPKFKDIVILTCCWSFSFRDVLLFTFC